MIVEPLVSWIWIGGGVVLAGTLLAAWPGSRKVHAASPAVRGPVVAGSGPGPDPVDDDPVEDEPVVTGVATSGTVEP